MTKQQRSPSSERSGAWRHWGEGIQDDRVWEGCGNVLAAEEVCLREAETASAEAQTPEQPGQQSCVYDTEGWDSGAGVWRRAKGMGPHGGQKWLWWE